MSLEHIFETVLLVLWLTSAVAILKLSGDCSREEYERERFVITPNDRMPEYVTTDDGDYIIDMDHEHVYIRNGERDG